MKNFIKKLAVLVTTLSVILSLTACTYRKDGYVWQDVTLTFNYQDQSGADQTLDSTLSLTTNITPKTTKRVLSLIKDGFYNDTAVVLDSELLYLELGSFTFSDNEYKDIIDSMPAIDGEFRKNGVLGTFNARAGSLVMLRNEDNQEEGAYLSYNTATYKFAILLNDDSIDGTSYCVFGKIDDESLEKLSEIVDSEKEGKDGKLHYRYLGDRDETNGNLKISDGKYVNTFEYLVSATLNSEIFHLNGQPINDTANTYDEDAYEITKATRFNKVILPKSPIIVNNFKIK